MQTIGQGTFGTVKLSQHVVTRQKVAIKIIEKASVTEDKQRNSLQREIRLVQLLHHRHIVKVYDVLEDATAVFFIMEYVSGGELFDYIVQKRSLSEWEARIFFRQMLSAMDYCHKNSIIHRDLKPENLLIDSNKCVKIIDFGFGNTFHRDKFLTTFCGSPFYAAPEMLGAKSYVGPEVDVWSLGVILYAMVTGSLPFHTEVLPELLKRIKSAEYHMPSKLSPNLADLIRRMLTVDTKKRIKLSEIIKSK
ncbi:kinase-like domain-containing protein [Blyttiomyces helicus]|uniref:non-specific serine/threonine protein kinase n=1 Tax=Blyttiomyces helicus TaxID=388810 RepID=A0A4P9WPW8_9FUNG|nr:kinase-like domain-containing protein [Blyttiomyces helicus]|eukprot:RKO92876.1 kinase-like domain-containing protein [Blyttiomyces helicus]